MIQGLGTWWEAQGENTVEGECDLRLGAVILVKVEDSRALHTH